ncbi:dihydropteroate synthase [bacterium]
MQIHLVHPRDLSDVEVELLRIGAPESEIEALAGRGTFRALRVSGLNADAARRLKDAMSAAGGSAAMPLDSYDKNENDTDVLLMGALDDFRRCLDSLRDTPELADTAGALAEVLSRVAPSSALEPLMWPDGPMPFGKKTFVMGIINCTPDSFYDGGHNLALKSSLASARYMIENGADIIDVGGESTRPGSHPVPENEETDRTVPFIKELKSEFPDVRISIDTVKATVASRAIKAGAAMINDVSGLRGDSDMKRVAAESGAPICIMHMRGAPKDMQVDPSYPGDVCYEINSFFGERITAAMEAGITRSQIVLDPGIGFGKTVEHNLEILSRLREFRAHGLPLLIGASRKSFIGKMLDLPPQDRLEGSLAAAVLSVSGGVDIVRVHDVRETVRAVGLADAIVRKRRMLERAD